MHDIKWIRENPEAFNDGLNKRNYDGKRAADLIALADAVREQTTLLQGMQERRNAASKQVGEAKKNKDETRAQELMNDVASLKHEMQTGDEKLGELQATLKDALAEIPNIPAQDVPEGSDEHDNVERSRHVSHAREYTFPIHDVDNPWQGFTPLQHFEIGEALGLMDFETAAKISGARFTVMKGQLARLERVLGQFMLDMHVNEHGYTEINPPVLVRDDAMFGTAQLPKFREDQFFAGTVDQIGNPDYKGYWLVPTAEVPLTNLVRESLRDEKEFPMRFTALTPCFRAEAGAAGRDTRGLIRQHQFSKVEMVSITTPQDAQAEHERMLQCAENVLKKLDLSYRVMTLCTGDMGFAAQKTYDIEVWLPGQNAYREISSCSVCGDFQARRMDARYRPQGEKSTRFLHTLNGSGLAVGRTLVAVLETYQNPDGSVTVPEALVPYMGGINRIER